MKHILMIAYHFPPVGVSSGVHRTLTFSQYLLEHEWRSIVLSISPKAYERVSANQLKDIPSSVYVKRAFGLDAARHLSIFGRYPGILALPDRWATWWFSAVWFGLRIIKKYSPKIIFSTYPIATAHLIGLSLHKITGIPWVCDFRDSMSEEGYPDGRFKWAIYRWIEQKAVENAQRVIFTTPGTIKMYSERYPEIPREKWTVIENGYDEKCFTELENKLILKPVEKGKKTVLVHSGLLYPSERDPRDFFSAIAELKAENQISSNTLKIILRASGHEVYLRKLLSLSDISDIVELAPPVDYNVALYEMLTVDGLLVFQAASCNHQIPAKIYEYLRAKKPILGLVDLDGDTANILRAANIDTLVELDVKDNIKKSFFSFLKKVENDTAPLPSEGYVKLCERRARAVQLSDLLDSIVNAGK